MDTLCERFLGLKHQKKKNMPHAFSETKISMALFRRWQEIYGKGLPMPKASAVTKEPENEMVEITGQELENFIQAQVRISI